MSCRCKKCGYKARKKKMRKCPKCGSEIWMKMSDKINEIYGKK